MPTSVIVLAVAFAVWCASFVLGVVAAKKPGRKRSSFVFFVADIGTFFGGFAWMVALFLVLEEVFGEDWAQAPPVVIQAILGLGGFFFLAAVLVGPHEKIKGVWKATNTRQPS